MSRRRPLPFRVKIALAAFAGLTAAWLLPRVGSTPEPETTPPPPTDRPGLTAVQIPLAEIPQGVSYRLIDGVRVFLVREAASVVAFHGVATTESRAPLYWCERNRWFETDGPGGPYYRRTGVVAQYSAARDLDRVGVLMAADLVTLFPQNISPGLTAPAMPSPPAKFPVPIHCPASERVG